MTVGPLGRAHAGVRVGAVYRAVLVFGFSLFRVLDVRRTVRGVEHVPTEGGAVLAITHFSYLDFALTEWMVFAHLQRLTRFLATAASFRHPVSGPLMRAMQHIPVERGAGAYRLAVERLQAGELVGVFPESRVTRSFTPLPLKTGAVRMAQEAGVPLVPIVLWGSQRVLTRTHKSPLWKNRHKPVTIIVGEPVHVPPSADVDVVTEQLRVRFEQLLTQAQADYPDDGTAQWWQPAHLGGAAPTPEQAVELDRRPDPTDTTDPDDRKKAA